MSENPVNVAENAFDAASAPIDVILRASPDITTTLSTTISATGTTTVVVASGAQPFPQSGNFMIRALTEEMLVTAGQGTGSWTVTRGINGTTKLASIPSGTVVALLVGVQRVEPVYAKKQISFKGRAGTFLIPGRAGTAGQKLFSIFNAGGSNVIVDVQKFVIDMNSTVAKTVQPPVVRVYKVSAAPTNGSAVTKVSLDSALAASNANVTCLQDASADNTGSATTLTSTLTAGNFVAQCQPSQLYTVAGFAPFDVHTFFPGEDEYVTLNAGEGLVVMLDYTASTANPTTDRWEVECAWVEYTNA